MLTGLRIVLHKLQFFRRRALVLGSGVEVSGTSRRFQLDLFATAFSHFSYPSLLDFAAGTQVGQNGVDALLVDDAQASVGNTQTHEAVFSIDPETTILQVRQEAALRFVIGVGNIVPNHRGFTRDLADLRYDGAPEFARRKSGSITKSPAWDQGVCGFL